MIHTPLRILYNPKAGKGRTLRALGTACALLDRKGIGYSVHPTEAPGHAAVLAHSLSETPGPLVVIGGDGTVSETLNGMQNFGTVPLGILPCGTGNDFAVSAGLPVNRPEEALGIILTGTPRPTDFLQVGDRRCMNVAGIGIDADVLRRYNRHRHRTKFTYMQCLVAALFALRWMHFSLEADGQDLGTRTAMITSAANGRLFGGGMVISPNSQIDDGHLDLVIVNRVSKWKMLGPLLSFKKGKLLKYPFVESIPCRSVAVRSDAPQIVNIDGELYPAPDFLCSVVSGRLLLYRP